jgi:hypothetical protein
MSTAILTSAALACLIGLITGFTRWWQEAAIVACAAVPLAASAIFAVSLVTSYLDTLLWMLHTFFYSFLCAFFAWGVAAGTHFGVTWAYRKLTLVRADAQKAARRST